MKTLMLLAALLLGTALTQHAIACDSSYQANATPMGAQGECAIGFCGTPTINGLGPLVNASQGHQGCTTGRHRAGDRRLTAAPLRFSEAMLRPCPT